MDLAEVLLKPTKVTATTPTSQPPRMPTNKLSWGRPLPKPQATPPSMSTPTKKASPIPPGSEYTKVQSEIQQDTYLQVLSKKGDSKL